MRLVRRQMPYLWATVGVFLAASPATAQRINQEGRILPALPVLTNSVVFNSADADAVTSAMQIFPVTNPWNEDISRRPVLVNSDAMIAQITSDLSSTRRTLRGFFEMNFALVPDSQPLVPIQLVTYPDESDPSPYPIPSDLPVEGWPTQTGSLTLQQWQENIDNTSGDRHAIIVQPGAGYIWETWETQLTNGVWQAANGAKFDLNSNNLRPAGWTSGDAAGLAMFPALPRYDECERGMVEHACRIVVARSRKQYIYPAEHYASTTAATQTNVPAMGQRLRLKSSFVIPATWAKEETALLLGLKKYGAIVADNGGFFSISIPPDDRWPANAFSHLSSIGITNFEVIQTTGPTEGPRSAGAPVAYAGSNQTVAEGTPFPLQGFVSFTGPPPVIQWKLYSGPGAVTFGNTAQTNTTAQVSATGTYTLMLSADDAVHAVAYSAVTLTTAAPMTVAISRSGARVNLSWTGGAAQYVLEASDQVSGPWLAVATNNSPNATVPVAAANAYFRVRVP